MTTKIDSLFNSLSGESVHKEKSVEYDKYREMWVKNPKNFIVGDFPLHLDIETSAMCNLRCKFCRTTYNRGKYPRMFFDFKLFRKVIDEGSIYGLKAVKFNWRGEPLLHPELPDMVSYAKDKGLLDVFFNTNLQLLTPELAERLVKSGLDRVTISAEGYTKELYETNRVGARFEVLKKNINFLFQAREKFGRTNPKIRIQTVLIPELIGHENEYIDFWKNHADEVTCLRMKEEVDYNRNQGKIEKNWACPQLWQRMVVGSDGKVLPCNEDDQCTMVLGNVSSDKISELWTSEKLQKLRRLHEQGESHTIPACNRCPLRAGDIEELKREK